MSTFSTFDIFAVRVRAVMQEGGHPNPKGRSKTVTCSDNLILYMKVKVLVTQCCPTFCNPMEPTRLLYLEFSREEHWNGLPFPPLGVKVLVAQLCLTLTPRINKESGLISWRGGSLMGFLELRQARGVYSRVTTGMPF